jgi:formate hydrogenlyase subunit 6/NADH:ubiquinone oxidoreductase subunit I
LIGLEPRLVPVLEAARRQRLGATTLAEMDLVGEDWRTLRVADFEKVSKLEDLLRVVPLPKGLLDWIRGQWTARPRIIESRCVRCDVCATACPLAPAAIRPGADRDRQIDDEACIRCYCCHELCPHQAIDLARPWLTRWLNPRP